MTEWINYFKQEKQKTYFKQLAQFIKEERERTIVFPKQDDVFNAFKLCPYDTVKVVILGQDPYHNEHQAHGLSFSVQKGEPLPPSLRNIFKELSNDLNVPISTNGDLTHWAKQGVLLLNTVLTVEKNNPNSHANKGWEVFTDGIISMLNQKDTPVIFVLWGNYAQNKQTLITNPLHTIIKSAHPSPLSAHRGFLGSKPFSKINTLLVRQKQTPIDWQL